MISKNSSKSMVLFLAWRSLIRLKTTSFLLSRPNYWRIFWIYFGSIFPLLSSSNKSKADLSYSTSCSERRSRADTILGCILLLESVFCLIFKFVKQLLRYLIFYINFDFEFDFEFLTFLSLKSTKNWKENRVKKNRNVEIRSKEYQFLNINGEGLSFGG